MKTNTKIEILKDAIKRAKVALNNAKTKDRKMDLKDVILNCKATIKYFELDKSDKRLSISKARQLVKYTSPLLVSLGM